MQLPSFDVLNVYLVDLCLFLLYFDSLCFAVCGDWFRFLRGFFFVWFTVAVFDLYCCFKVVIVCSDNVYCFGGVVVWLI